VVVALGDSLTAGIAGTPGNYPAVLATLLPSSWEVVNRGIPGNTTVDMLGRFDSDVTPLSPQYVIVLAGINDDLLGQIPSQIEGHLSALYQDTVAIGATPIPVTLPPFGHFSEWTTAIEATRVAVNAWIRQQPYVYVDAAWALADPANEEDLGSAYDAGDGIHLSPAGQAALADAVLGQGLGLPAPAPPSPTLVAPSQPPAGTPTTPTSLPPTVAVPLAPAPPVRPTATSIRMRATRSACRINTRVSLLTSTQPPPLLRVEVRALGKRYVRVRVRTLALGSVARYTFGPLRAGRYQVSATSSGSSSGRPAVTRLTVPRSC
jgi:lysophospholipase L1-like esterase